MNNLKKSIVAVLTVATLAGASVTTAQAGSKWGNSVANGVGIGIGLGILGAVTRPRHNNGGTVYIERECWDERVTYRNNYGRKITRIERVCN